MQRMTSAGAAGVGIRLRSRLGRGHVAGREVSNTYSMSSESRESSRLTSGRRLRPGAITTTGMDETPMLTARSYHKLQVGSHTWC